MKEIDFLPQKYRDQHTRRRNGAWRLLVVGMFGGAIACAAIAQWQYGRKVARELLELQPMYAQAQARTSQLSALQQELVVAKTKAALYGYLRHPWPTTRILATIVEQLPKNLRVTEIDIAREAASRESERREEPKAKPNEPRKDPALVDLEALQKEDEQKQVVLRLKGEAASAVEVHDFLDALNGAPIFQRVDLGSLEKGEQGKGVRFTAMAIVGSALPSVDQKAIAQPLAANSTPVTGASP